MFAVNYLCHSVFVSFFSLSSGLTLTGDEDGCGCVVKSVLKGGAIGLDGRIGVGDHIVAVNDESMIGLSGHRARYPNISLKFSCAYRVIFELKLRSCAHSENNCAMKPSDVSFVIRESQAT